MVCVCVRACVRAYVCVLLLLLLIMMMMMIMLVECVCVCGGGGYCCFCFNVGRTGGMRRVEVFPLYPKDCTQAIHTTQKLAGVERVLSVPVTRWQ